MLPGLKGARVIKGEKENLGRGAGSASHFVCGHDAALGCGGELSPSSGAGQQLPVEPLVILWWFAAHHMWFLLTGLPSVLLKAVSQSVPGDSPSPEGHFDCTAHSFAGTARGRASKAEFAHASASHFSLFIYFPLSWTHPKQAGSHPTGISCGEAAVLPHSGVFRMGLMCRKIPGQRGLAGQGIGPGEVCCRGLAVPSTDKETHKPCSTQPRH